MKMKINNDCKLCDPLDNQKISGDKVCRHHQTSVNSAATAAFLSSPHYFRDFLAFHILKGYYQPAGPLISPHMIPPPPQSISQPLESDQSQSTQTTSSSAPDNGDPDVMITGGDLTPRPYRYGPHPPPPDYSRQLPHHQMHPYPSYPYYSPYGGHPPPPLNHQELCYPPYYPPKYFPPNSPYTRRYMTSNYYPPLDFRPPPQAVPQNPQSQILSPSPAPPQHIDPYTNSPYYAGYTTSAGGQCYSQTQPRNLQPPFLDAPHFHTTSCPCPKNALTGTGLIINNNTSNGPVSASKPAPASSSTSIVTSSPANNICKIENILAPSGVTIKPENNSSSGDSSTKSIELFSHVTRLGLEQPETTSSPARGSTGLQIPATVQPEASTKHPDLARLHHHHHYPTYMTTSTETMTTPLEISTFKQEFTVVKKETNVDVDTTSSKPTVNYGNLKPIENVKVERLEKQTVLAPAPTVVSDALENTNAVACNESSNRTKVDTVNLVHESGDDECIDYTMKRHKSCAVNDDVIELSDNSLIELPTRSSAASTTSSIMADETGELSAEGDQSSNSALTRPKLLAIPINIPKKSPPNSYKSLIKAANGTTTTSSTTTTPVKNKKTCLKRRSILKPKSSAVLKKKIRMTKKRFLIKKKSKSLKKNSAEDKSSSSSSSTCSDEADKSDDVSANESTEVHHEKSDGSAEETSSSSSLSEKNAEFSEDNKSVDETSDCSAKSNIDETIDRVAKGYFSESEILTTLSKYRKKKIEKQIKQKISKAEEKRKSKKNSSGGIVGNRAKPTKGKKDESKQNKIQIQESEKKAPAAEKKKSKVDATVESHRDAMKVSSASKSKKPIKKDEKQQPAKKVTKIVETEFVTVNDDNVDNGEPPKPTGGLKRQQKPTTEKKPTKKSKPVKANTPTAIIEDAIPTPPPTVVESDEDEAKMTLERDDETSTTVISSSLNTSKSILDETDVANNNNECFENNNQMNESSSEAVEEEKPSSSALAKMRQEPLTLYKTPGYGWTTLTKCKRGKKAKFTNRKKQKVTLLNDIVIPRCTSTPRWSNGWTWVGEPFQAYVFLDSDNPPVPRTCYESMRHEECGDVIRPGDCVLLRAGGKKNELPYVAKVAQLWENPEDGEMMMSLLWYYRPEHTEQGRLDADAVEEVFASRHKDHNSVACIEDKCYVLTYNEYCRYRRVLKMLEENLDEQPSSLVPRLAGYHDRRPVPKNTSPELVMFCRRVYDFRAKRLVEDKNRRK